MVEIIFNDCDLAVKSPSQGLSLLIQALRDIVQETGGVGLNDDAVIGRLRWEELRDWPCTITSTGSVTTGDQKTSKLLPEEVWPPQLLHTCCFSSLSLPLCFPLKYHVPELSSSVRLPFCRLSLSIYLSSVSASLSGWWLRTTALLVVEGEMTKDSLIVTVWVSSVWFSFLPNHRDDAVSPHQTDAAKSLISISQQCNVRWNYSGVTIHWLQLGCTEAWWMEQNINKSHLLLWRSLSWFA